MESQTAFYNEPVETVLKKNNFTPLIVLMIRTRLPFYKSKPSPYLVGTTLAVVIFVLALPYTALGNLFGFVHLPFSFYGWMLLIVTAYIVSAEFCKRWFYRRFDGV